MTFAGTGKIYASAFAMRELGFKQVLFLVHRNQIAKPKEFYYLGKMFSTGVVRGFTMPNTDKTAVEIEWMLETPVREDIYEYIVNG